jgi:hypothetical protein
MADNAIIQSRIITKPRSSRVHRPTGLWGKTGEKSLSDHSLNNKSYETIYTSVSLILSLPSWKLLLCFNLNVVTTLFALETQMTY